MTICYNTSCYKWTSLGIFVTASVVLLTLQIIDITIKTCDDAYHSIDPCLNSSTCALRYCEPTICHNYTCLPRVYHPCRHRDSIYYPDDRCPDEIFYKMSWINLICIIIIIIVLFIYILSLIHYRCHYYYRISNDDSEWVDLLNDTPNPEVSTCPTCNGFGADLVTDALCSECRGKGRIIKSKSSIEIAGD